MKIKLLNNLAKAPTRGSEKAAGMDLYAAVDGEGYVRILPHETVKIGTGLAIEIPVGYVGAIYARSGIATKRGLRPANCVGLCDSDYRGEYIVALHNDSDKTEIVEPNERIAQLVIMPHLLVRWQEIDELSETERGDNGFGSTGAK